MPPQKPDDKENLRTEYTALSAYFNTIITFRLTTAGLLLGAVGLILGGRLSFEKYFILLVLTVISFFIELRNRSLADNLSKRAMQIERIWGYIGGRFYEPFHTHMNKPDEPGLIKPAPDTTKIFGIEIAISHTTALNLLYSSIFLYALFGMWFMLWR